MLTYDKIMIALKAAHSNTEGSKIPVHIGDIYYMTTKTNKKYVVICKLFLNYNCLEPTSPISLQYLLRTSPSRPTEVSSLRSAM